MVAAAEHAEPLSENPVKAPREGKDLVRATKEFASEDRAKTWRLLAVALTVAGIFLGGAIAAPWLWAQVLCGAMYGIVQVRLFIFYHDYCHGALLRKSKVGDVIMSAIGFLLLAVRSVWRETHNYHHKHNAKLIGSSIGSFPLVTAGMYRGMSSGQKRAYRMARHPLTIFGGYFTVFLIGMTITPFRRAPKRHWGGPLAVVLHFATFAAIGLALNWPTAFCAVILPSIVAMGAGSYLFFAQHNFPDAKLRGRREWDYTFAALNSSSMFDMGPVMHWLTGNIGYHHIHHLNHRIPFYRLPEAMNAVPELQNPGRTSFKPSDIIACLRCGVWDDKAQRMVSYAEAAQGGNPVLATEQEQIHA